MSKESLRRLFFFRGSSLGWVWDYLWSRERIWVRMPVRVSGFRFSRSSDLVNAMNTTK